MSLETVKREIVVNSEILQNLQRKNNKINKKFVSTKINRQFNRISNAIKTIESELEVLKEEKRVLQEHVEDLTHDYHYENMEREVG